MVRARGENFPVATRLLGRRTRAHLLALAGFARLADELGDGEGGSHAGPDEQEGAAGRLAGEPGDAGLGPYTGPRAVPQGVPEAAPAEQEGAAGRLEALDWLEEELDRAYAGRAEHPLLVALEPTLRECRLPREPFARLIEANRVDQRVSAYRTWEQLRGYCALSANPVGELVLGVFGQATPARVALSDSICTALQLIEHCQDVAEDRDRGRVYLPAEDLARFGATAGGLWAAHAGGPLRATIAFELARARTLFALGAPLIDEVHGPRMRLAVAAFIAGGRAAVAAIEQAGHDVLAGAPRAGTRLRVRALAGTLTGRGR